MSFFGCVTLRWSGSGSVIQDHSDHGESKEPINPGSPCVPPTGRDFSVVDLLEFLNSFQSQQ